MEYERCEARIRHLNKQCRIANEERRNMFNVVTIAREYGSGGADIGRIVAELLGWVCVDKQIIEQVAAMVGVDPSWAAEADEHASGWWERVMKGFRQGGPDSYVGQGSEFGVDHDTLQQFTADVIERAAKEGNCVIIGRSSQCVLRQHPNVLHVLVFAPMDEKIERMRLRHPDEHNLPNLLYRVDYARTFYTQRYYGRDWSDRGQYHLCVNSTLGLDASAKLIAQTIWPA
jgi:cytidylate kinase